MINKWPMLKKLYSSDYFPYVALAFTEQLMRRCERDQEELALFLCYLFQVSLEGHLCLAIHANNVEPAPHEIFKGAELSHSDQEAIVRHLLQGARLLPAVLVASDEEVSIPLRPLFRKNNLYYLQRHWVHETHFLSHLKRMFDAIPEVAVDELQLEEYLSQVKPLISEQAAAIRVAAKKCLTIVTGGPGTGKTFTVGHLIRSLLSALPETAKNRFHIVCAAPTGKAAGNLQSALSKTTEGLQLEVKTLHALLGVREGENELRHPEILTADLVIVDEASMIDVRLISRLFASMKQRARLVLIGDKDQLPPVESGNLFADLAELSQTQPLLASSTVILQRCLRSELVEISSFASEVNSGNSSAALERLNQGQGAISRIHLTESAQLQQLVHLAANRFPLALYHHDQELEYCLELFDSFRLLTPLRQGPWGAEALNEELFNYFLRKLTREERLLVPIMIAKNDYAMGLFNGDMGLLIVHPDRSRDYALFRSSQAQPRRFLIDLLPPFDYAYCLTVHKSQGSEFQHVLLMLPPEAESFGREIIYTAVTRAKQKVEVCGTDAVIKKGVERRCRRYSGVALRLNSDDSFPTT